MRAFLAPKLHQMLFVQPRRYIGCDDMSACAFVDDLALQISLKSVSNVQSVSSIQTNINKWGGNVGVWGRKIKWKWGKSVNEFSLTAVVTEIKWDAYKCVSCIPCMGGNKKYTQELWSEILRLRFSWAGVHEIWRENTKWTDWIRKCFDEELKWKRNTGLHINSESHLKYYSLIPITKRLIA